MPRVGHPFRETRTLAAVGGAYDDVSFGPIREDRLYRIDHIAVEDETSAPSTDIRVLITGHGDGFLLLEQDLPQAATLYWDDEERYLRMGEALVARFTGATAADRLRLYVEGVWYELDPMMEV